MMSRQENNSKERTGGCFPFLAAMTWETRGRNSWNCRTTVLTLLLATAANMILMPPRRCHGVFGLTTRNHLHFWSPRFQQNTQVTAPIGSFAAFITIPSRGARKMSNLSVDESNESTRSVSPQEEKSANTAMHTVTWTTAPSSPNEDKRGDARSSEDAQATTTKTFLARDGETLRTAALRRKAGVSPHNGRANLINCRGLGTCGTCAVEIPFDQQETCIVPKERNQVEQLRLSLPPHNTNENARLRLACQIQVKGDIDVLKRTGFWGQKQSIAEASDPQLYFGDLEFLLDNKSPPPE